MGTVNDLLRVASGEVGYSRWTDEKRGTKYGRWYAALGKGSYYAENGVPYCAMFVSWCATQAGVTFPGLPEAYCPYLVTAAKKAGRWVGRYQLQPGDLVLFDWTGGDFAGHVGIVERVFPTYIQTIEGNTSAGAAGSQSNGGLVARRTRALNRTVMGGVRGTFTTTTSTKPTTTTMPETLVDEDEEAMMHGCTYTGDDGKKKYLLFNENSGFYSEFGSGGADPMPGSYINPIAQNWQTKSWPTITAGHAAAIKRDLDKVRQGK